jgi:hypothetical protein
MTTIKYVLPALALSMLLGCSEAPQTASQKAAPEQTVVAPVAHDSHAGQAGSADATKAHAAARLQPFKQQLMQALKQGMQEGAENAIDVCRLEAPAIAAATSGDGVQIGRSSHRLRNPNNAPTEWQQSAIDHYLASEDREPMLVDLGDGQRGYMEPIMTAPMCLACHGSELAPGVKSTLAQMYPDDQATDFAAGDLRGIFWVSLPAAQTSASSGE